MLRALAEDPNFFLEVLGSVYKPSDASGIVDSEPEDVENAHAVAERGFKLLEVWNRLPGTRDDGTIDGKVLEEWIKEARAFAKTKGRENIADERIGNMLSASSMGLDGNVHFRTFMSQRGRPLRSFSFSCTQSPGKGTNHAVVPNDASPGDMVSVPRLDKDSRNRHNPDSIPDGGGFIPVDVHTRGEVSPDAQSTHLAKDSRIPVDRFSQICQPGTPSAWVASDDCLCLRDPPSCGSGICAFGRDWPTWEIASRMLPACIRPDRFNQVYGMRCGSYHAIAVNPLDSAIVRFYDSSGKLIGVGYTGLSTLGCTSYDPTFVSPIVNWGLVGCEPIETPVCPIMDASNG